MKHLINREDYIREYLRVTKSIDNYIESEPKNENELYEGLLGTLFGGLKMLLKKDWDNIKCKNPSVLEHLKAMDKSLSGFTMTKMQYSSECQSIRQNIADYFNDILSYKLSQIEDIESEKDANKYIEKENKEKEEEKELKGIAKMLNLRDKALLENIKKYKENIAASCKANPKLREYADQLMNSITIFVNDVVIAELEKKGADAAKLEEEKKKMEEERKKQEEERKKKDELTKKENEEKMKKLADERDKAMRDLGVKPIGAMDGDKAIDTIAKQYSDMLEEFNSKKLNESALPDNYSEVLRSDTYIGIQKSLEELDWNFSEGEDGPEGYFDKFLIRVILNKINTVFGVVSDNTNKSMFKNTPSASVQAMLVSLSNAVIYGFMGNKFDIEKNEARLSLMTKCAIDSDATIGFNLPLIDDSKPDNGNYFVSIMNQFKNADISSKEVEDAITTLSNKELEKIKNSNEELKKLGEKDDFAKKCGPLLMKDFRQNMSTLFDIIVKKAKDIKEKAEKEREAEAAKAQQESEANETKE
jgi:hypothetical protein